MESMWRIIPGWFYQPRKGQKWRQLNGKRTYLIVGRAKGQYGEKLVLYKKNFGTTIHAMDVGDFMDRFVKVKEDKHG